MFILFFLWSLSIFALETDFDCIVVGSSPTSMFEAIYQTSLGKRVALVEKASECGGAWKSIKICGIQHADMGCHELGNTQNIKQFLEKYAGCTIIPNAPINEKPRDKDNWGFYPAHGCYELIHNLEFLMNKLGTHLLLNSTLESVFFDMERGIAEATINGRRFLTSKIVVTTGAGFKIENPQFKNLCQQKHINKYPHIYLLISDPTPSRFTYMNTSIEGASRAMNLTQFVGLEGSGTQLIAIQVQNETYLNSGEKFLAYFKKSGLLNQEAEILQTDSYIFEQVVCNFDKVQPATGYILEFLPTGHISMIGNYISKWKLSMRPWREMVEN